MNASRGRLGAVLSVVLAGVMGATYSPSVAFADEAEKLDQLIARAEAAVGTTADSVVGASAIQTEGDRINVALHGNRTLTIGLPNTDGADAWSHTPRGALTGAEKTKSVVDVVEPAQDGVRVLSVIEDSSAPSEFVYEVSLGAGSELRLDKITGGGAVISADQEHGVAISPPWAVDANGVDVPTHYEVRNGKLVQVVSHTERSYAYPIVADPTWNSRWFGGEIIFSRSETAAIAYGGGAAAATILGSCSWIPRVGRTICGALGAALGLNSAYFLGMYTGGKCGKYYIYFGPPLPTWTPAPGGQTIGDKGCY